MNKVHRICTFDEWLSFRCGMTEQEFRRRLEDGREVVRLNRGPYASLPSADWETANYRRIYKEEMDIIASEDIDLTFLEWLKIYERHTPESFHKMCEMTGMSPKEETWCMDCLMEKWERRHELLITGSSPFEE